jgi:DNA adenine methylase
MNQPLKWHGGKHYLAKWIISHFPPHTHYLEPFFGGGSVLLAKDPKGTAETVNDLDANLIVFWRVLRDPCLYHQLVIRASLTPFSDYSYWESLQQLQDPDPVVRACAFLVRNRMSRQGLMKSYATPTRRTRRGMHEGVAAYLSAVADLPEVHERLQRVEIRQLPAAEFIAAYDHKCALFYCDPPYLHDTRSVTDAYRHEMPDASHVELLNTLRDIEGRFVLSGYYSTLYEEYALQYAWRIVEVEIDNKAAAGSAKRVMKECLWMNF